METYQKTIRQQQIQSLLDNFLHKTFHCNVEGVNLAAERLNSLFDLSASLSNLKMNNNDKCFDEECKNIRKKLRNMSNQKHRDPENLSLRLHYGESLKQYRNTLRKKKEQQVRNLLNVIEESIDSNHFWENRKTLNKQHKEFCIQNGDVKPLLQSFWLYNKE